MSSDEEDSPRRGVFTHHVQRTESVRCENYRDIEATTAVDAVMTGVDDNSEEDSPPRKRLGPHISPEINDQMLREIKRRKQLEGVVDDDVHSASPPVAATPLDEVQRSASAFSSMPRILRHPLSAPVSSPLESIIALQTVSPGRRPLNT